MLKEYKQQHNLPNLLEAYRQKNGLTYEELGKKVGLKKDTTYSLCQMSGNNLLYIRAKNYVLILRRLKIDILAEFKLNDLLKEKLTHLKYE